MPNRLRISLVIPAYNEESYLEACLESALAQELPFHEIIVVDNNSTDATSVLAQRFPSVTLLHEAKQGVVYARNRGFDAVTGDIIARIDADTRLPAEWTKEIQRIFEDTDTAAVTGNVSYYDIDWAQLLSQADNIMRRQVARLLGKDMALQGANMAIRRSSWLEIRNHVCNRAGVHEDFDLAIHAGERGLVVTYDPELRASVAFRQAASPWQQFASYYWHCPSTYLRHGLKRGLWLLPMSLMMMVMYPLFHLLSLTNNKRLSQGRPQLRVNPATFGD